MPRVPSRIVYHDHVAHRGVKLFEKACQTNCEGIIAKWAEGTDHVDGRTTSWLKIKNPDYSQMEGRREVFERRSDVRPRRTSPRVLCSELTGVQRVLQCRPL